MQDTPPKCRDYFSRYSQQLRISLLRNCNHLFHPSSSHISRSFWKVSAWDSWIPLWTLKAETQAETGLEYPLWHTLSCLFAYSIDLTFFVVLHIWYAVLRSEIVRPSWPGAMLKDKTVSIWMLLQVIYRLLICSYIWISDWHSMSAKAVTAQFLPASSDIIFLPSPVAHDEQEELNSN